MSTDSAPSNIEQGWNGWAKVPRQWQWCRAYIGPDGVAVAVCDGATFVPKESDIAERRWVPSATQRCMRCAPPAWPHPDRSVDV